MNKVVEAAAAGYIAPKLFSAFRFRWLVYGAAAYFGLRYMSKRGIFPKQADAALGAIDKGIDVVKSQVGITGKKSVNEQVADLH